MGVLVLGLGNILLSDEGLGCQALERLTSAYRWPDHVALLEGGTLGLDLLPQLVGVTQLLILDAVQTGQLPGTLVRLEGKELQQALQVKMSMHQVGLQELLVLSSLEGTLPPEVVAWGLEPASLDWGVELSPIVSARLDGLVAAAVEELQAWGVVPLSLT